MQLNYFPINIEFEKFQILTEPYNEERLRELRNLYNTTHSFFRSGDSIYISNKDADESVTIGNITELSTYGNANITASLIKHLFFRTFKDRFPKHTPLDFYPFRFFSGQQKDDIIHEALPNELKNKIAYKKLIELQLRLTEINGKKQFGFLINIKRNWVFTKSCADLHTENYNLIGVEVLYAETLSALHNILAPNEEFVGIIKEIVGTKAIVNTNEGEKKYELKELFIRKTKFNIGNYLTFATSQQKSDEILSIIEHKREDIYNPKKLYNEIIKIANALFSYKGIPVLFQNKDGFCFTIDTTPLTVTNTIELKIPNFIFDPAATKITNTYPDKGLNDFGPYDSNFFDIKSPNILCICKKTIRGQFTQFLSNLKNGLPQSRYFKKGLLKKYDLQNINFVIKETQSNTLSEYLNVIREYDENKPHLAIIEIPESFKLQADQNNNPYYQIKAKLLSLEIPVQFVTTRIVNEHNEYILNSMALQIYAKLGGTPWVLPTQRSVDRELVIGIGHSWLRKNQYVGAENNRVVGITTFLSSDGQYLLGDKVKDVAFENYFEELLKSLKKSIQRLSTEQGWSDGDTVRLIFHIFKPIKNVEFDVISQLIKETSQYKIKFAFVTIDNTHPTMLFDPNQQGVISYGNNTPKGEYIPVRASNIFLDAETCIIQMLGANELKTSKHGMSKPVQIKIRTPQGNYQNTELNDMLFYDLSYITQQIFSFTYLSWRSFLPAEEPATMKYSNLISKLLGKMRNVQGWDADKLNYGLKRKKWFL
ncbi:Piwi domain-containing protein [Capnocytophaga canis]|uniref:Protein argonaute n=1 Tax=Capnocytophaga canis TaxID=1848903 RepID=A0A0B7I4Z6_9FLAO|nr:Piwi domain-containing protein [Capnocytophaga canis]CEN45192.1 Piwi domain protein [Capnocytophaga canis]